MKFKTMIILLFFIIPFTVNAGDYDFQIGGDQHWTKSPYRAIEGQELAIVAQGSVKHSLISGWYGPDGNSGALCGNCRITSNCAVAALIMKIGNSKAYCVGTLLSGAAPASGDIYFAINDVPPNDNEGNFSIKLTGPGVTLGGNTFD